jgi:hypothetical protein
MNKTLWEAADGKGMETWATSETAVKAIGTAACQLIELADLSNS